MILPKCFFYVACAERLGILRKVTLRNGNKIEVKLSINFFFKKRASKVI